MSNAAANETTTAPTLEAVEATIAAGRVLHIRADRLPAKRSPRRDAMPAADFTLGPDARGGFLLVDYAKKPSGVEDRYPTALDATRAARKLLGWDRLSAARTALRVVHGEPEQAPSLAVEDARLVNAGERMRKAFGHKPDISGPIFGPSGRGFRL